MLRLDDVLAAIPERDLHVEPVELLGGLTNKSWRLSVSGQPAVLRLGDPGTRSPADFHHEIEIHERASAAGLAPRILFHNAALAALVTAEAPGRSLVGDDLCDDAVLAAVAQLLARVHRLPPSDVDLDLRSVAGRYQQLIETPLRSASAEILERLHQRLAGIATAPACLCHNDPVAANFLSGPPLTLIDWEFAANGDSYFDLAVVSAHHRLDAVRCKRLLEYYGLAATRAELAQLRRWQSIYCAIHWLWLASRSAVGGKPVDRKLLNQLLSRIQ